MADLEDHLGLWRDQTYTEALQHKGFIGLELHESILREIIQKWENFNPHSSQAQEESAVIQQLEVDAQSIPMMVKLKIQE